MSSVFLSHSHADKAFTRKLAAELRAIGHSVWIDEAEINVGDSLVAKIREGLDKVDFVAAVLSSASIQSEWVTRELDIASNREMNEKRVVVLPLLREKVDLPGFLKGKFYADFTDDAQFADSLALLLRALGPISEPAQADASEIAALRKQVADARAEVARHMAVQKATGKLALKGKNPGLVAAIEADNARHPLFTSINATYAFQIGENIFITLGYMLWVIQKVQHQGAHPIEVLLDMYDAWPDADRMLEAYSEVLEALEDK
ncbi:toll/interleukin-1 receptor domain-containing protein [Cupriavidus basilensis]|uniref:toll/interleukin-1 receptor domain-containing protein n=1 Tax=Cupriavidus basilensis TaxID=68895 RepID=UPI0039F6537C